MNGLYSKHKKDKGASVARSLAKRILEQEWWNISATARILGCSRKCIRRCRDGTEEDISRRPFTRPSHQISSAWEELILQERNHCSLWRVRMSKHILRKYWIQVASSTIRNIYRRNKIERKIYKRSSFASKPLYDYEKIRPFEIWQVDTKHIEDFSALWSLCFIPRKYHLPLYQWTYICAKTKIRFLAYSYTLSPLFWKKFMEYIAIYIRWVLWITYPINFQTDNWPADFCWWSKRKEEEWNTFFQNHFNASFKTIPAWKKYLQWIVERSHRTDDEELYRPKLECMTTIENFMYHTNSFLTYYNTERSSYGIWMNGMTPLEKLMSCSILQASHISHFGVFLLDTVYKSI